MDAFYQITDDGFPGAKSLDFIGQRIVYVEPFGRYWGWSDLVDASSWNSLEQAQAETSPDRIQGLIVSHNEVLIFGERTIEPWAHAPTDTAVFQLQVGSVIESGCASGRTIQRLDNSVFYLTNNGQIAKLNGYTPQVISTAAMEASIRGLNWSRAFAFTWEDAGHVVYYITFPDGHTWGYDVRQGKWHRRASYGLDRWRINALAKSNGKWIAGDYSSGRVYEVEWGNVYEACEIMPRTFCSGVLHNASNRVRVDGFRLVAATGQPPKYPAQIEADYPDTYLLVTGQPPDEGEPMFAAALANSALTFVGIPQSSGATVINGAPAYFDGVWGVFGDEDAVISSDDRVTWVPVPFVHGQVINVAAGPDGWATSGDIGPVGPYDRTAKADPIEDGFTSYAFSAGVVPNAEESYMARYVAGVGYFFDVSAQGYLTFSETLGGTQTLLYKRTDYTSSEQITAFKDIEKFGDALFATCIYDFGTPKAQLRRSNDGGVTWPDLIIDRSTISGEFPFQLQAGNGKLLCISKDTSYCFTSDDDFAAAHLTGIAMDAGGPPQGYNRPRGIAYANGLFYIVSGVNSGTPAIANCCVSTADGITFSEPVDTGIFGVAGIAASTDLAAPEPVADTCTPMEGGVFQLRYSNDGAENWSNWRDAEAPRTGWMLQPLIWRRLGMARHRVWEVMDTSNRPQDVLAAEIIASS